MFFFSFFSTAFFFTNILLPFKYVASYASYVCDGDGSRNIWSSSLCKVCRVRVLSRTFWRPDWRCLWFPSVYQYFNVGLCCWHFHPHRSRILPITVIHPICSAWRVQLRKRRHINRKQLQDAEIAVSHFTDRTDAPKFNKASLYSIVWNLLHGSVVYEILPAEWQWRLTEEFCLVVS
jgi:hypothetical protein